MYKVHTCCCICYFSNQYQLTTKWFLRRSNHLNKWKPLDARSSLYDGCFDSATQLSAIFCLVWRALWGVALSWWKMRACCRLHSTDCQSKLVRQQRAVVVRITEQSLRNSFAIILWMVNAVFYFFDAVSCHCPTQSARGNTVTGHPTNVFPKMLFFSSKISSKFFILVQILPRWWWLFNLQTGRNLPISKCLQFSTVLFKCYENVLKG